MHMGACTQVDRALDIRSKGLEFESHCRSCVGISHMQRSSLAENHHLFPGAEIDIITSVLHVELFFYCVETTTVCQRKVN